MDPVATLSLQWMIPPPPSKVDYAECVAANCNMDIEITDPSLPSVENATCFSFSLPASNPYVPPRRCLTLQSPVILTFPQNPLPLKSSHTALTFQQTPVYGIEIL